MRPRVQSLSANAARPNIAARRQAPALFLGLSLAGFAAACSVATAQAGDTGTAPAAPLRCEIALDAVPGGTRIEGRVISATAVSGTYDLAITSRSGGGRTKIRQSGDFDARPGAPALLGETELYGVPASHSVDLDVRIHGQRLTCAEASL